MDEGSLPSSSTKILIRNYMGIKSATIYDLVCDNCGEVFINRNRILSQELACKAGELGWKVDNDHKYYCPKCKDAIPDLIMKYH